MQDNPPGTGYRVTYEDFVALLTDSSWRGAIRPLVEKWFDCTSSDVNGKPVLKSATGEILELSAVHEQIQSDKKMQYDLYQAAMNLWR